jgi:hypothetical protein
VAAGIIVADGLLRLPLDDFWPGVHLAPYAFVGFGGILLGSSDNEQSFSQNFTITDNSLNPPQTRTVTATGRGISRLRQRLGTDRVLGHVGGGLEYRFTCNIGIFGEVGYVFPNLADNNFVQINFGLRYAF